MNRITRSALLLLALASASSLCLAQGFSVTSDAPPKPAGAGQVFVSLQGRFTISLPKQVSAYSPISTSLPEGRIEGDSFSWRTAEGLFELSYIDLPSALATKAVFDRSRDNRLVLNRKAKLAGERDITLAGNAGRETKFELPDGIILVRTYLVGSRLYESSVTLTGTLKGKESAAAKVLDSFKLLSQAEVEAARRKEAAELTPSPLPGGAASPKLKTDAEDEGLKGRVKTVFRENQDLSGTWAVGGRKPSMTDYYDEKGQLTKHEGYDYKGNLFEVAVYGYLDGERVRSDKTIQHEYDPPPVMVSPPAAGQPTPKSDPRYSWKFRYRYDGQGRLVEEDWYGSSGKLILRYTYKYEGDKKEELVYSEDGSLNQHYLYTLDGKGDEVEETSYDVRDGAIENRYSYTYEFDARGNWTKRTTSKWAVKDGKGQFVPDYVTYRTITYY